MSRLYLKAENYAGRTVISESFFSAPLKIAKPFYHENFTTVMMMSASAGMLDGDCYDIEIKVCTGARLRFTGQSFNKIFRSTSGKGVAQKVKITVESGGELIYSPCPVIPFRESIFKGETDIEICDDSKIMMYDIFACGRTAMNEKFQFTEYRSRISVKKSGRLIFLDNTELLPSETDLCSTGFFEGNTHSGTMFCYGFPKPDIADAGENAAVTDTAEGWCARILADSSQHVTDFFEKIKTP